MKALQELRSNQRAMLIKINELNKVPEYKKEKETNRSTVPFVPLLSTKSSPVNSSSQNVANQAALKRPRYEDHSSPTEDFLPFNKSGIVNGNKNCSGTSQQSTQASRINREDRTNTAQGVSDIAQRSKEAVARIARENAARRRLVKNSCDFFQHGKYILSTSLYFIK
jgi:hypothetical protein